MYLWSIDRTPYQENWYQTKVVFGTCPYSFCGSLMSLLPKVEHSTSHTSKTSLEILVSMVGEGLLTNSVAIEEVRKWM